MPKLTTLKPEQLRVLKPGTSVALKLDLPFDDGECAGIESKLEQQLKRMGVSIDPNSELSLIADVVAGENQTSEIHGQRDRFGRPRRPQPISFTPHTSSVRIQRAEQTLWQRSASYLATPFIRPQENETLQEAADRVCEPTVEFFTALEIPTDLKALPPEISLGESTLGE